MSDWENDNWGDPKDTEGQVVFDNSDDDNDSWLDEEVEQEQPKVEEITTIEKVVQEIEVQLAGESRQQILDAIQKCTKKDQIDLLRDWIQLFTMNECKEMERLLSLRQHAAKEEQRKKQGKKKKKKTALQRKSLKKEMKDDLLGDY